MNNVAAQLGISCADPISPLYSELPGKHSGRTRSHARRLLTLCGMCLGLAVQTARALTYVSSSLTDSNATNGNGVSTPSGSTNIQYSDGSSGGTYGQIDIADDPADPDWVYDLGSTKAISSMTFWSYGFTTAWSQMPSGTITIYRSSNSTGPWTQIGTVTRSMVRETTAPISQATAGEGFRVPCDGSSGRYVRINVVTPSSTGGIDDHWVIRRVEENSPLVIHSFYRDSDSSSALNDAPRVPYNAVDGNTATMWNPLATSIHLTLDIGPAARRFQQVTFTPNSGDGSYLPGKGEVRVSSTDDPDNMDIVVGYFDVAYSNVDTDAAIITLPQPFTKRFVEIHWTETRTSSRTETRIAEIAVNSVAEKPTGIDITASTIPSQYRAIPNDGLDDAVKIQAAMESGLYSSIYLPAGTYNFITPKQGVYMLLPPSGQRLYGAGDATVFAISNDAEAVAVLGKDNVMLDHFKVVRTSAGATNTAIMVTISGTDIPYFTELEAITVTDNHSRAAAITLNHATYAGVVACTIIDPQRQYYDGGVWSIFGAGIDAFYCDSVFIAANSISESRDLYSSLSTPIQSNGAFYQASGIETSNSVRSIVWDNYVERFGNGIDIGGTNVSWIAYNEIQEIWDTGIKLVNGTRSATLLGNSIDRCGLNAIWLSPGSANLTTRDNVVLGNVIYETGQGISNGWWTDPNHFLSAWAPAGIVLDKSDDPATRTQSNTVMYNDFYFNGAMHSPASTYAVWQHTGTYTPTNNTISNNTVH